MVSKEKELDSFFFRKWHGATQCWRGALYSRQGSTNFGHNETAIQILVNKDNFKVASERETTCQIGHSFHGFDPKSSRRERIFDARSFTI
jgi:hypothetical protein